MATTLMTYLKSFGQGAAAMAAVAALVSVPKAFASDHNDGPRVVDPANHPADITDVYCFREGDQSKSAADNNRAVLVMTLDGLVPPGQTHKFDPTVQYELHVGRGAGSTKTDKLLAFRFSNPDAGGVQQVYLNGSSVGSTTVGTQEVINQIDDPSGPVKIFAGPRDDPFFLDLQVIRCGVGCAAGAAKPEDSFGKANVSAIVLSAPAAYLAGGAQETKFSVWGVTRK